MDTRTCLFCRRPLLPDKRGQYCNRRCVWRAWRERTIERSTIAQNLPLTVVPADVEPLLPVGTERLIVAVQHALIGRAPDGARGYRLGIQHGVSLLMRWFPAARSREVPMFYLDPFEWPSVPVAGSYAVVYLDGRCLPLGGPRFTVAIDPPDRRVLLTDGDRTYKPRPRW